MREGDSKTVRLIYYVNEELTAFVPPELAKEARNPTPYTLHPTPYTLHPTLPTLHPAPCTLTSDL